MTVNQIDKWLRENYPQGFRFEAEHPNGTLSTAMVVTLTTDNMHSSRANGVMVVFEDKTIMDIPFSHLYN